MRFQVIVPTISKEEFDKILNYYNTKKDVDENKLEILDRSEGGFKIAIPSEKWTRKSCGGRFTDENEKIQQLRWSNGYLISMGYIGFTEKQYMLLYDSLVYALPGKVLLKD